MVKINPCKSVRGVVCPPGDKSIAHRFAMIGAIAEGETRLHNFAPGQDCQSTLNCMRQLGAGIEQRGGEVLIQGRGLRGLCAPKEVLDSGNSGTTLRLLSGILAGQHFESKLSGDASLCKRPMKRILDPLRRMGAQIEAREGGYAPIRIVGGPLRAIDFNPDTPSAQVKSCVLLAGLYAAGRATVQESVPTRDHTELALSRFGADLQVTGGKISLNPVKRLMGVEMTIPGDLSSAVFWIVAAAILPGSSISITGVGLNPTRNAVLGLLANWGADIRIDLPAGTTGEVAGDLRIGYNPKLGAAGCLEITHEQVPLIIDEIPALAVLGARTPHGMRIRGAGELRVKESDRLHAMTDNLNRMGVAVKELSDGLDIPGNQRLRGAQMDSFGDHRIAMACAVAALSAEGSSSIEHPECAGISYPGFYETLESLAVR
jgi:3-phosphoshikimate 1-carboxyvinyltransferase